MNNPSTLPLATLFEGDLPKFLKQIEPFKHTRDDICNFLTAAHTSLFPVPTQEFATEQDPDVAAAIIGLTVAAGLNRGNELSQLNPYHEKIKELLTETKLSPTARAFLLLHQAQIELIVHGDLTQAESTFRKQQLAAEKAASSSLKLLGAAFYAYCLTWSGDLAQAEIILKDSAPLLVKEGLPPPAIMQFQISNGLISALCGQTSEGFKSLSTLVEHPGFTNTPPTIQLLTLGHLLDTRIIIGNLDEIERNAEMIRALAIPDNNNFYRSHLHFNLGMAALSLGRPHKALRHSEEARFRSGLSQSPIAIRRNALLHGLTLADLGRRKEALSHLQSWVKNWQECNFNLIAALGYLEISAIHAATGDFDQARLAWKQAYALLPPGEKMPYQYRPTTFYGELEEKIFPEKRNYIKETDYYPVKITTLGEFFIEINQKKVSIKEWRGRKSRNLLFALIAHGGRKVPREQLATMLWQDSDGDLADNSLNVTLSRLRRIGCDNGHKPFPWLVAKNRMIWLDKDLCRVDALDFKQEITKVLKQASGTPALTRVLDSYSGSFLPTFKGLIWLDKFRDELAQLYVRGVLVRIEELLHENQERTALALLAKASSHAPLYEKIWGRRMQIHIDNGEAAQALSVYRQAETNLAANLDIEPGPRLQELARIAGNRPSRQVWSKEKR